MTQEFIGFLSQHFNIISYFIALFFSLKYYRKYFDTALKFFPMILAYTLFNELLGYFIRYSKKFAFFPEQTSANDLIYNIYAIIFFGFFYQFYFRRIERKTLKILSKFSILAVILVYIISCFYMDPLIMSLYYAHPFASIVLVLIIIFYFQDRIQWKWSVEKYNLVTWVSFGLLSLYSFFPVLYLIGFKNFEIWMEYNLRIVLKILIVIMLSFFCIGFVKSSRRAFR